MGGVDGHMSADEAGQSAMTGTSHRVTIRDVACLAGVSPATVSKVLNDAPYVSTTARQQVLDAVGKLDFRPNTIARSLHARRTYTLGLITDDLEGLFTTSMMRGVDDAASEQDFSVFLYNSQGQASRERSHLNVLRDKQVDGVILLSGYRVRERAGPALDVGKVPLVYLYQYTSDLLVPCVVPDDEGGGRLGAEHLILYGRKRIALINGPARYEATQHRLQGYREALETAGLVFDPGLVRAGTWHQDSGYRLAHEFMALPEPPDAIFCTADSLAVGAIDALHQLGYDVPKDVAIVGFDNRPFAAHQRPPLTTVALPLYEMGKLAGELLLSAIRGRVPEPVRHHVPCYLVHRDSCGELS